MDPVTVDFISYKKSIKSCLDAINAPEHLARQKAIMIKPNLVNSSPHPITTAPECCESIIEYIQNCSKAKIVIAEGCGAADQETAEVFEILGYRILADKFDIPLIDLNHEPLILRKNRDCPVFPEMYLPKIGFSHYVISVPVLKVHSLSGITGTLKNMMGFAPPQFYSGGYNTWKKALFHNKMQQSIADLNRYLIPDLSIMDCSTGMAEFHLGGARCDPPVSKIIAGYNPWKVDRRAAELLGLDWHNIEHIAAIAE